MVDVINHFKETCDDDNEYYESTVAFLMKKLQLIKNSKSGSFQNAMFSFANGNRFSNKKGKINRGKKSAFKVHQTGGLFTKHEVVPLLQKVR